MSFFPPAKFDITANASQALAEFKNVSKALGDIDAKSLKAGGSLGALEKSLKTSAAAAKYLGLAMIGVAGASIKTVMDLEKEQSRLATAIKNAGVNYSAAQPYIEEQSKAMRDLGFSTEETYAALSNMILVTRSPEMAFKNLALAADLARAGNVSLTEAADMLSKAALGQTKALSQFGIQLGVTIKKGATYQEIIAALEKRVRGSADAFRSTLAGSLAVANAKFEEFRIKVGTALMPEVIKLTDWITNVALPKLQQLANWFAAHKQTVINFGLALGAIWATSKIAAGVAAIVGAVKTLVNVYKILKTSALAAYVAEMLALNPALGVAAAATIALIFNTAMDRIGSATDKFFTVPPSGQSYNEQRAAQIAAQSGGGVGGVGAGYVPGKQPPGTNVQVTQNITVYAKDANSMTVELAKAARNGVALGAKQMETAVQAGLSTVRATRMASLAMGKDR